MVKNPLTMQETQVQSLDWKDPLEKGMVTHASILAWKSPWTEELGSLRPWGCKESDMTERLGTQGGKRIQKQTKCLAINTEGQGAKAMRGDH